MKRAVALLVLVSAMLLARDVLCKDGLSPVATPASLLSYVDTKDGISRAEANDIAQAYFLQHVGCGSYSGISDGLGFWVVDGHFGYSGTPIEGFFIDKRTGAITSTIGPSYESPGDMLLGPNNSFKPNLQRGGA
jgi:hypothetical protein